jgi:hypothetical protein
VNDEGHKHPSPHKRPRHAGPPIPAFRFAACRLLTAVVALFASCLTSCSGSERLGRVGTQVDYCRFAHFQMPMSGKLDTRKSDVFNLAATT